jgi:hypothetical protein
MVVDGKTHPAEPRPQLYDEIKSRIGRAAQGRPVPLAVGVVLAIKHVNSAGAFIARNPISGEVIKSEITHL